MIDLLSLGKKAVKYGENLGASEVETYLTTVDRKTIDFSNNIEALYASFTSGLGVRVCIGKRLGFFATSSFTIEDIERSVKTAFTIAKVSEPDNEWVSLPVENGREHVEQTYDKKTVELQPDQLTDSAMQMINAVKDENKKNLEITRGNVSIEIVETAIVNSYNCSQIRAETYAAASISVKAKENKDAGVSSESHQKRSWLSLDCSSTAKIAADRAIKIIHAKPIGNEKMPVVWKNKLFASILRIMFGGTLSADSVQKGRSPWIGKIGESISSKNLCLIDDGLLTAGLRTREFDDEGIPQKKITIIDHGILQNFLYDNYTANKDKRRSTGNAHREYSSLPTPLPNNLILESGEANEEDLIRDLKRGLYVVETIGAWLSNPISGDLSATVTNAFLIENGEISQPVKATIISGNFFDILLNKIDLIANDTQNYGSTYSPSVRVSNMNVTGDT